MKRRRLTIVICAVDFNPCQGLMKSFLLCQPALPVIL